jgi:hypothetical protein
MALSFQTRIPLRGARSTLSTGHVEASALFHAGSRVTSWFYIWATAGLTKLTPTPGLEGWPQRQWAQVYEAWMEFPLSDHWDIVAQARYQSPLLDKQHLEFQYDSTEEKYQQAERAASGWNALTAWRGNEALGFRYHFQKQNSFLFLFQEDWAIGDNDGRRNFLYVNGSPDVALVSQLQIAF